MIQALTTVPEGFKPIKKVQKVLEERAELFASGTINWSMGELLAYGTMLTEGRKVRITGQEVMRGTFAPSCCSTR